MNVFCADRSKRPVPLIDQTIAIGCQDYFTFLRFDALHCSRRFNNFYCFTQDDANKRKAEVIAEINRGYTLPLIRECHQLIFISEVVHRICSDGSFFRMQTPACRLFPVHVYPNVMIAPVYFNIHINAACIRADGYAVAPRIRMCEKQALTTKFLKHPVPCIFKPLVAWEKRHFSHLARIPLTEGHAVVRRHTDGQIHRILISHAIHRQEKGQLFACCELRDGVRLWKWLTVRTIDIARRNVYDEIPHLMFCCVDKANGCLIVWQGCTRMIAVNIERVYLMSTDFRAGKEEVNPRLIVCENLTGMRSIF